MSEYQYYEFQTVDRLLTPAEQAKLRAISTRAQITATCFTNDYQWGDLKADPTDLLLQYFDLHFYCANWGYRRFAFRLPEAALSSVDLDRFPLDDVEVLAVRFTPQGWLVDIDHEDEEVWYDVDDGSGWMAPLASLRSDLLAGDYRVFYVCWLWAVEAGYIDDDAKEPLPGIAPLTPGLQTLGEFLDLDPHLLEVAARRGENATADPEGVRDFIAALPEDEKNRWLERMVAQDPLAPVELRRRFRQQASGTVSAPCRRVGELRDQARQLAAAHRQAEHERAERLRRQQQAEAERLVAERRARVASLGERAWQEVEEQIASRQPRGYERAVQLLRDLRAIADDRGSHDDFDHRLRDLITLHHRKQRFLERLTQAGLYGET